MLRPHSQKDGRISKRGPKHGFSPGSSDSLAAHGVCPVYSYTGRVFNVLKVRSLSFLYTCSFGTLVKVERCRWCPNSGDLERDKHPKITSPPLGPLPHPKSVKVYFVGSVELPRSHKLYLYLRHLLYYYECIAVMHFSFLQQRRDTQKAEERSPLLKAFYIYRVF